MADAGGGCHGVPCLRAAFSSLLATVVFILLAGQAAADTSTASGGSTIKSGDPRATRTTVRTYLYGSRSRQVLDATMSTGRRSAPWVLAIHGGYWSGGSRKNI